MSNKKKSGIILIVVVVAAIAVLMITKINSKNEATKTKQAIFMNAGVLDIKAIILKPAKVSNQIIINGNILAEEEVTLNSEISGRVTKIGFQEGTIVKKGDLLLKINDADLQAQLRKAVLNRQLAEEKEYRQRKLFEKQGISKETYDIALNELNSLKADIDYIKAQIDKTEIRAPFNGIVGIRSISEGAYITPAIDIATIQSVERVKIDFAVPQKYYSLVKKGDVIEFNLSSTGKSYEARIYAVEPRIDQQTRTLRMMAIADNRKGELSPGAFVEVEIPLEDTEESVEVPSATIVPDISGETVFVYSNGKAIQKKVITGIRDAKKVQVIHGISPGDTLISSGIIQLRDGTDVKISEYEN